MIVNGSPVEFTQREVLTASVFLQIRASEILSIACKIYALSANEFSLVRMHNPRRYTDHYLYYNDMIYINATMLSETNKIKTLIISYLLYVDDAQSIRGLLQSYDRYSEWMDNIESELRSHQRNMQQYYESIALFTGYRKWDMAAFIKAARKYKALAEVVDDGLSITFKNVRCGNETEGYIQYKSIQLFLSDDNRMPSRVIYTFNNFFCDSDWNVPFGHLHPHIAGGSMCLGNRVNDYALYVTSRSYPFIVEILKESVNNYSPDGPPYSNVASIRTRIAAISKLIDINLTKDKHKSLKEVNDISSYLSDMLRSNRCRHCGSLMADRHCTSSNCDANPDYQRACSRCGTILTIGRWSESRHIYLRTCENTNCSESPNYVNQVDIPYCRVCGSLQMGNMLQCGNNHCRGRGYIQWNRNSSGRYAATTAFPMITPEQAEQLRQGDVVERDTPTPSSSALLLRFCPHCFTPLVRANLSNTAAYTCTNNDCPQGNSGWHYFDYRGEWISSAPRPRCPECDSTLQYRRGEGFFCDHDNCENYDSRLIHADGSNAIPF